MELQNLTLEQQLRRRLDIPPEAERVLIFSESSHWDPNWLLTADAYFDRFVRHNLDQAIQALQAEPRRIYSVECMFFLRLYWDRFPQQRDAIRELVNNGRLRLTGSGVTTADTLIPSTEAILRDMLIGQEWLRANGMRQEPFLAYFTDSFGCTPALPSLLNAAGFDRTALTRVDGMYFMGCDLESSKNFPRPGSTAERLLHQERSLDFIWRDRNGAQLLCHWNAFTYGQGDMLAYTGLSRVYLVRVAMPARSDRHVARRIAQYVSQLSPLSRTPYLFCPIGFDFVEPIPDLVALLDRYNRNHYPTTGVWAVNAGLDDYLALAETHSERLPVLEIDPNPYWTGFYTARPTLKQRARALVEDLLLAERLSLSPHNREAEKTIAGELEDAWWKAAVSNHHDFITGTSPDKVAEEEQIPWLDQAAHSVREILNRLSAPLPPISPAAADAAPVQWSQKDGRIHVETQSYRIDLAEEAGGGIVFLSTQESQTPLLTGPSHDLISYRDSGGLWRMGMEFSGGVWKELARASRLPVRMEPTLHRNGLEIVSSVELDGETLTRRLWLQNDSPVIFCRVEGKAAQGHSVTVRFATGIRAKTLWMDTPGGMVERPPKRVYTPTFWPLHQFVHLQGEDGGGVAIFQPLPGAVAYHPDGQLELIAIRNATKETAFGWIGIPGNPASGHEREPYTYEFAILFTPAGDWRANNLPALLNELARAPWSNPRQAGQVVSTNSPEVRVAAVKPASRGEGVIVRLTALEVPQNPVVVHAHSFRVAQAWLCDARERDLEPLEVVEGAVRVTMPGTVTTLRLIPK